MADAGSRRRVVVTGIGAIAANGQSVDAFWSSLKAGTSGIGPLVGVGPEHLRHNVTTPIAGQIRDFDHKARLANLKRDRILPYAERCAWLAAAAADEAVRQSGLTFPAARPERVAVIVGSATGGQATVETASRDHYLAHMKATHPLVLIRIIPSSPAAHLGIEYAAKGPVMGICSGCASADHAIAVARDYIRHGLVDIAIAGGTEAAITYGIVLAMQSLHVLAPDACRPFAANRSGTVLGEGAGILVLEAERHARARGARMLAELAGVGMTASATDLLAPEPEAAAHAMRDALADAGLVPESIDYLNAFGVGTRVSDRAEARAIGCAFGAHARRLPVSSTKPITGYAIGATGALEAIACIKAVADGFMPPTLGLEQRDPECDLDHVTGRGRRAPVRHAMTTTLALGGMNTALVIGPPPAH